MDSNFKKSKKIRINTKNLKKGLISSVDFKSLKFKPKRIYYIYNSKLTIRGGHANRRNINFYICLNGSCEVKLSLGGKIKKIKLFKKNEGLVVYPKVRREIRKLQKDTILLSICSMLYSKNDII